MKIWGRPGAKDAQRQVESYWTAGVAAGAVIQLTDADVPDWPEVYRGEVLEGKGAIEAHEEGNSVIRARFTLSSELRGGMTARVDHLLLQLPRR